MAINTSRKIAAAINPAAVPEPSAVALEKAIGIPPAIWFERGGMRW